jgi:hypothetical protein
VKHLLTVAQIALLIVATVLIFEIDSRTLSMRLTFGLLWLVVNLSYLWGLRKSGVLGLSPSQVYRTAGTRPRTGLLTGSAILIGNVALLIVFL